MIEQRATVISRDGQQVWLEAKRQSTCGQCSLKQGCGSALLSRHVGRRFSRIAVPADELLRVGQQVTVSIPEQALLNGAVMMYLVPLLLMFAAAALARQLAIGELAEIVAGIAGLCAGFAWVSGRLKRATPSIQVHVTEDSK